LITEAMRRAFAVRNHVLGDPDFIQIPQAWLLSKEYADQLRASISHERATPSAAVSPGIGSDAEGKNTTHFSVVDSEGNAVAFTTSINIPEITVRGAGFLINSEMDDFASKPGAPNLWGLIQGEANAIEPGKRMLSSMTPTIVLGRDEKPLLITGASGGPTIISAVFQIISNVLDYNMDVSAAVNAPRIHHQHFPDELVLDEGGFTVEQVRELEALGHAVEQSRIISIAAAIKWQGDVWHGMSDLRIGGLAQGH